MSALLEIVELVNGDIVLQRAGGEGGALMTIRFSDESREYLPEERLEVARAMIHAGIESASHMEFVNKEPLHKESEESEENGFDLSENFDFDDLSGERTLH